MGITIKVHHAETRGPSVPATPYRRLPTTTYKVPITPCYYHQHGQAQRWNPHENARLPRAEQSTPTQDLQKHGTFLIVVIYLHFPPLNLFSSPSETLVTHPPLPHPPGQPISSSRKVVRKLWSYTTSSTTTAATVLLFLLPLLPPFLSFLSSVSLREHLCQGQDPVKEGEEKGKKDEEEEERGLNLRQLLRVP